MSRTASHVAPVTGPGGNRRRQRRQQRGWGWGRAGGEGEGGAWTRHTPPCEPRGNAARRPGRQEDPGCCRGTCAYFFSFFSGVREAGCLVWLWRSTPVRGGRGGGGGWRGAPAYRLWLLGLAGAATAAIRVAAVCVAHGLLVSRRRPNWGDPSGGEWRAVAAVARGRRPPPAELRRVRAGRWRGGCHSPRPPPSPLSLHVPLVSFPAAACYHS